MLVNILMAGVQMLETNKYPRLHERNIIVPVDKK